MERGATRKVKLRTMLVVSLIIVVAHAASAVSNTDRAEIRFSNLTALNWNKVVDKLLTSSAQPRIFPTPAHKNYFSKIGYVEPTRDWMHLHITFNFTSTFHYANTPCRCVAIADKFLKRRGITDTRHVRTRLFLQHAQSNFKKQCTDARSHVTKFQALMAHATSYSNAPGHSDRHDNRAIPALLWTAVSAAVGPSGFSLAKFILGNISKTSFIFNIASSLVSIVSFGSYLIGSRKKTYTKSSLLDWDAWEMEAQMRMCQSDTHAMFLLLARIPRWFLPIIATSLPEPFH